MESDEPLRRVPALPGDCYPSAGCPLPGVPAHNRAPARKGERGPDRPLPPGAPREAGLARAVTKRIPSPIRRYSGLIVIYHVNRGLLGAGRTTVDPGVMRDQVGLLGRVRSLVLGV